MVSRDTGEIQDQYAKLLKTTTITPFRSIKGPQVYDHVEEVSLDTMEEPRITYISYLLPTNLKE